MRLTLTETVSFSLTMGTTPIARSSLKVLTALRYLVRFRGKLGLCGSKYADTFTHIGYVASREQHLRDGLAKLPKKVVPQRDEPTLADRSESLHSAAHRLSIPHAARRGKVRTAHTPVFPRDSWVCGPSPCAGDLPRSRRS